MNDINPNKFRTSIIATGSYLPEKVIKNNDFLGSKFFDANGEIINKPIGTIIDKFQEITGIKERRYVGDELVASDIGYFAALDALNSSQTDKETLDYIIVAHNFGDVRKNNRRSDFVPTIAARIKHKLGVKNPLAVAYDLPFGCPGWLQGVIQADSFLKACSGKRALVIGTETLSRISDPHDRDSMLYSDGAGAVVLESSESEDKFGVISHTSRSDTYKHSYMLQMDKSYNPGYEGAELFLKMQGHQLYKYALQTVPAVVEKVLDMAGIGLKDVSKVFLHQANEKMDEEILRRIFSIYGDDNVSSEKIFSVMPMTISWLGNSSVATLPTLIDLVSKNRLDGHSYKSGDYLLFASVGAGMNVNALVYKVR